MWGKKSWNLLCYLQTFKIARNISLHQVFDTRRCIPPVLAETLLFKAVLIAASTIEIPYFIVFSVSPSLVNLLKCEVVVNEQKSIQYDFVCLLGPFSSILIFHVNCTAYVLADLFDMYHKLSP